MVVSSINIICTHAGALPWRRRLVSDIETLNLIKYKMRGRIPWRLELTEIGEIRVRLRLYICV